MAKEKALPKQGAKALVTAWGDANARMLKNGNKKKKTDKKKSKK